jgi:polysaccharide export outer membrane protein
MTYIRCKLAAATFAVMLASMGATLAQTIPAPAAVAPQPPGPAAAAGTPAPLPAPALPPDLPMPGPEADSYIIGPGDGLQIFVWRNPELSANVQVLPDGRVSTPLVEGISATGKTPAQLARAIEQALSEYVRQPRVSVLVSQAVSTFSQVKIIGQVRRPGTLPYRDGMTVLDALLQSGGLSTYAAGNRAKIMRRQGEKVEEIRVKLDRLVEKGDLKQNVALRPGDILVVPEAFL